MTKHVDHDELQDFREGLLTPDARVRVQAHLEECSLCREELEALSGLLEDLGDLPLEAQPSRDLWPQIAWRMEGTPADARTREHTARRKKGWVRIPVWQLAAAGVAISVLSGGVVWALLSGGGSGAGPVVAPAVSLAQPAGWEETLTEYDEAVADLESVLEHGREVLDGETVRILEENLETIDSAIREAAEALDRDPGSGFLRRLLSDNLRRKVNLLRLAASAVYANT
jgi:anti-sigma-K factor RskA